ncbi:cellulose synthase subunit BcsC-related outer membrane protein [Falsiroseomonas sp. HC035]|uniref:cellulose synthase subunit BcsC-related outer membrane protein n=1 Tax=Falsiroseomonas sp. HC035 TaxID=3390999 RepID=UPI003D31D80C
MRKRLPLALLATLAAGHALAQEAPGSGAVNILIRQAERWLGQDRPDLAAAPVERALAAEPQNPSALAMAARLELARGNRDAANGYLARLQRTGATAQLEAVQDAVRASTLDRTGLEEARRLAQDGRAAAAVQRYRAVFGNRPPPEEFAVEYYQALAGAPATREEGVRNLGRIAERPGADGRARLAYAQALTFDPATRAQGLERLRALSEMPEVAVEARRAWAAGIGFAGNDPAIAPQAETFLRRFPEDASMAQRLAALRSVPAATAATAPDPDAAARQAAFERLEAGALGDSARRFEALVRDNPRDADSLGGLGIIRLREGNLPQARDLLERAIAANPANARQWQRALDAASYGEEVASARAALRRGALDQADAAGRRAALRDVEDRSDAEAVLGEIALRRGDAPGAEARFRAALARRPGLPSAQAGLNAALRAQNRGSEVVVAARQDSAPRGVAGGTPPAPAAATAFRNEAARMADPTAAAALLRNAVAAAPDDPWILLDLARALRRQGRGAEGRALVEELAARVGTPDATYAAALMAEEDGRLADADAFLARIPANRRSTDMSRLATRIRSQRDVAAAVALMAASPLEGRTRLLTIAARPDPTGATAAAVIRAFGEAGDRPGAGEAARVAAIANRAQVPARVAIAGALLSAGLEAEAVALAAEIEAGGVSAEAQRDLAALRGGAAIRAADRLNEAGDQAGAFERLRPALANGSNPEAQLALARLYITARQPAEALRIAEMLLARDPRNVETRRATIEAAIAAGDRQRAAQLLAEGRSAMPGDARMLLLEARVARDAGDGGRARQALEAASRQRAAELGVGGRGSAAATPSGLANPFGPAAVPRQGAPADPLTRDIERELAALRDDVGPSLAAVASGRMRSGDDGLDKLSELSARLEAVAALPVVGGRITAFAEPTTIDAGSLENSRQARQRFGASVLNGAGALPAPGDAGASGVGVGLAYQRGDWLRADVGTTPIGFQTSNIIGGAEIAPQLTAGGIRARFTAERRGMNDSLLSWSGATDPRTGASWGPVLRTGGRAQIEFPLGNGYGYVGGGYSAFDGSGVASNTRIEGGAGVSIPIWRDGDSELRTGLDLVYLAYERNLRYFTLGHGGYFSPQQYTALNIPVDYRGRNGDLSYRVGATLGYAAWREDAAPVFPNDPELQGQLVALASATAGTNDAVLANFRSQSQAGAVGGVRADLDYALNPSLSIGAGLRYDKASNFDETRFQLRLRNRF